MITAEDIKRMTERGESYNVDFKVAVPQKVRDIGEAFPPGGDHVLPYMAPEPLQP